jgi:hypothetical protein
MPEDLKEEVENGQEAEGTADTFQSDEKEMLCFRS